MSLEERVAKALQIAMESGGVDGAHHKAWVIDQMVRALTGCPMVPDTAIDAHGKPYTFERQGESDEYMAWVVEHNRPDGEDHDVYEWEEGIAP